MFPYVSLYRATSHSIGFLPSLVLVVIVGFNHSQKHDKSRSTLAYFFV